MWRFYDLVAPSKKFKPETANMDFPFSVKPDKKLSVQDVMAFTRDKSQGTLFDPTLGIRGGPFKNPHYYRGTRLISVPNVEYTSLTQCRSWLPDPVGGLVWIAFGVQDTSCYIPVYAGSSEMPKSFQVGDHFVFSRDSARWACDYVDFHVQVAYNAVIEDVKAAQKEWEDGALAKVAETDALAAEQLKRNPKQALKTLTGFSLNNAQNVVQAWWKLGDDLLVKYNHLSLYDAAKRRRGRIPTADPEWWNKAVRAFDILMEPVKK
jgi:dipeptidase